MISRAWWIFICLAGWVAGAEPDISLVTIPVPSRLQPGQWKLAIKHRFYRPVTDDPFNSVLGTDQGANVQVRGQIPVWKSIAIIPSLTWNREEYGIEARYSYWPGNTRAGLAAGASFYSYERAFHGQRINGVFMYVTGQPRALIQRAVPAFIAGYECHNRVWGGGVGVTIRVYKQLRMMGEYLLSARPVEERNGVMGAFEFGLGIRTYGHWFSIQAGNNSNLGFRHMLLGAEDNSLRLGFTVERIFGS